MEILENRQPGRPPICSTTLALLMPPCGTRDNCTANAHAVAATPSPTTADQPFPLNSRVTHAKWGRRTGHGLRRRQTTILFDAVGSKTLAVMVVQ